MSSSDWFRFPYEGPDGMRLDHYLRERYRPFSRSAWSRRVQAGQVLVNGRTVPPARRMRTGDTLSIDPAAAGPPPDAGGVEILYEDEWLVAVNKAAGILVHPVRLMTRDTVVGQLSKRWPGIIPCHRLDKLTSGLVLLAKDLDTRRAMQTAFEDGTVEKEYLALAEGEPEESSGVVDLPLGRDLASAVRIRMSVRADGDPSVTRWDVVERLGTHTLLRVCPETGRKHQIRAHLAWLGHPIHGDFLYGREVDVDYFENRAVNLARDTERWLALHARALSTAHPRVPGRQLKLEAPLPPRFEELLREMRGRKLEEGRLRQ